MNWFLIPGVAVLALFIAGHVFSAPAVREIPPAFGRYVNLKPADFVTASEFAVGNVTLRR